MKKIYLSPENRPAPHGPYSGFPGVYEHDVCCEIAALEKEILERCGCSVTVAEPGRSMAARCAEANAGGFDLYQTLHTNAGGGTGAECLYYGKEGGTSYRANRAVYDALTKLYPSKRGLKDGTGYAVKNPYVLGLVLVSLWNAVNDPTTQGLSDSERAMGYERPGGE